MIERTDDPSVVTAPAISQVSKLPLVAAWRTAHTRFVSPKPLALRMIGLIVILVAWQLAAQAIHTFDLFPTALNTLQTLWTSLISGDFPRAIWDTIQRILVGFVLGSVIGILLGLAMGDSAIARRVLEPYVHFFRFVTAIAWISPAAVWFGVGSPSVVFLIFYATTFIVLVNTMEGVLHVKMQRIRMGQCFGATQLQLALRIIAPSTIPFMFAGMRIAMSNSFTTAIGTEMLTNTDGIGDLIYQARAYYQGDVMFSGIIVVGLLGFLLDRMFVLFGSAAFGRFARQ